MRVPTGARAASAAMTAWLESFEDLTMEVDRVHRCRRQGGHRASSTRAATRKRKRRRRSSWSATSTTLRDGKIVRNRKSSREQARSPRSRRAVGVGDVAGERGDRAARYRSLEPARPRRRTWRRCRPGRRDRWSRPERCMEGVYRGRDGIEALLGRAGDVRASRASRRTSSSTRATESSCSETPRTWRGASGIEVDGEDCAIVYDGRATGRSSRCGCFHGPSRSPRSRRAFGVGDVAGERGDRARGRRGHQPAATSTLASRPCDPDVELATDPARWPDVYRGHAGVATSIADRRRGVRATSRLDRDERSSMEATGLSSACSDHARPRERQSRWSSRQLARCAPSATARSSRDRGFADRAEGPRSRRAVGVGDVAGERGDRAAASTTRTSARRPWTCSSLSTRRSSHVNPAGAVEPGLDAAMPRSHERSTRSSRSWRAWQIEPEQFDRRGRSGRRWYCGHRHADERAASRSSAASRHVWTLRDGKVVAVMRLSHEPADALEAAGLRE